MLTVAEKWSQKRTNCYLDIEMSQKHLNDAIVIFLTPSPNLIFDLVTA